MIYAPHILLVRRARRADGASKMRHDGFHRDIFPYCRLTVRKGAISVSMPGSSKYDALRDHLLRVGAPRIAMSIGEIEEVLGFELCQAAGSPSWWANTKRDAGRAQRRAWRTAGYDAFLSPDGETVEFMRAAQSA